MLHIYIYLQQAKPVQNECLCVRRPFEITNKINATSTEVVLQWTLYTVEHKQLCISRQSVQFCSARPRPISSTLPKCGDILRLLLRPCHKFLLCIMVGQQMFDIVHTKGEMSRNCQSFIDVSDYYR